MYFCAAASSENDHGSMNLDFEHRPGALDHAVQRRREKPDYRMLDPPLDGCDDLAGIALVPMPIERFGHHPKLDHEVARKVLGLRLAALFPPEAKECSLVIPHDGAGIGAADELAA